MTSRTVYLNKKEVPEVFRQHYHGNKFRVVVTDSVTVPANSGLWDGGSRDIHAVVDIFNGDHKPVPFVAASPWSGRRQEIKIDLISGYAVVETSIFRGKDHGRTIYISPANANALLPLPADLSENETIVLKASKQFKASHNGKDRYEIAKDAVQFSNPAFITREQWNEAKQSLIDQGYLNKAGAITIKGRNAVEGK